jgi:hypothetical protein
LPSAAPAGAQGRFPAPAALFIALCLAAHLAMNAAFIRGAAATYDEAVHLASGWSYLATGRYRLNIMDHPPLAEMWAALPLWRWQPNLFLNHPDWLDRRVYHYSDGFFYHNKVSGPRMLNAARFFCLLSWTFLLGWALLAWAGRPAGPAGMCGAAFAAAFMPVLGTNLSLATTDGAAAVFYFLTFYILSRERRSWRTWIGAGLCIGAALGSKFNMVLLPLFVAVLLVVEHFLRPSSQRTPFPWTGALVAGACACTALAAVYRFDQAGLWRDGLSSTLSRLQEGRGAFLHGRYSVTGFRLYFPTAFLIKTPIALLLLGFAGLFMTARARELRALWVLGPLFGYALAAMGSKTQIGIRHLLPIIPFFILLCARAWAALWERRGWGRALLGVLAAWTLVSVLRVQPYGLAYFNESMGGPDKGWQWLVDSNLDWGQDLQTLGKELEQLGNPPIYLSYFGCADPAAYGIRYVPMAFVSNVDRPGDAVNPAASGRMILSVSATNLQCVYFADKTLFDWLKKREPLKVLGHSIFLYDLTGDGEGLKSLAAIAGRSGRPDAEKVLLYESALIGRQSAARVVREGPKR